MKARDLMTSPVVTIHPDATVREAARRMLEAKVGGLPVVDDGGNLVGILTETDFLLRPHFVPGADHIYTLMGVLADPQTYEEVWEALGSRKVREVMRREVITVKEDTSLAEITRLMVECRVHRIPVVRGRQVVGIVTRHDLLKVLR